VSQVRVAESLDATALREMLRRMLEIRHFDTRILELYREGLLRGSTHSYVGMEAVAVGACAALRSDDYITSTHRGHGHCIAKGGKLDLMMAELLGKATGYCKGKGGSMHIADLDVGILGANGIVGGGIGIATGAALTAKMTGNGRVCVCFFGDGGVNQGILYESANMAAIWKLPIVYLCENNQFAMSTRVSYASSVADLSARAQAFGIPGASIDGMDVLAVHEAVAEAVARARAGGGPSFLAATTYRFFGHNVGDSEVYRTKEEVAPWRERDPIPRFRAYLVAEGILTEGEADEMASAASEAVERAIAFAKASPEPGPETLLEDVYA
jgi:pyruvate dehydrogenase E1 component alpha subunit